MKLTFSPFHFDSKEENRMATLQGFWSYVHADDQSDSERVSRLARDVVDQFQMLTGETISLFLDKDALSWGDDWHDKIDSSLASVAFFIPVMTPRYFMSPECRRELQFFAQRASELGIKELILPLHYVDVAALHDDGTNDELVKLVRTFQWEDWRELRFSEVSSEAYRRGVARLASRLVDANRQAEKTAQMLLATTEESFGEGNDELPGTIDVLANFEEMLQKIPETLNAITSDMKQIGQIMQDSTGNIERANKQGKGFSARLIEARQSATKLSEPTDRVWSLSNEFASQIHDVDAGLRIIVDKAPMEIKENPESKMHFCNFFQNVRGMSHASEEAIAATQQMINASEPLEKMSRDLRPVLRRLKQGLTILIEASGVSRGWIQLIDGTGIVCDETLPDPTE
jgi:methyl-accepting chemotaxis protein